MDTNTWDDIDPRIKPVEYSTRAVRFNLTEREYIEVSLNTDGSLEIRGSNGPLVIKPNVSNSISVGVEAR